MRAAKVQASLRIRAVSPEPPLLAHTSSESRGTFRQKARSLAPLNGWACTVKICHDGMLEDTNSLDAPHIFLLVYSNKVIITMEDNITLQTSECCMQCRNCNDKYGRANTRESISIYVIIIMSTVIILCICTTIYFISTVQELNARYSDSVQNIKHIEFEMLKLEEKHDQLERELQATKSMVNPLFVLETDNNV